MLEHQHYSPDISINQFQLLLHLNKLRTLRFLSKFDIDEALKAYFPSIQTSSFLEAINMWKIYLQKYIARRGEEYFE